jgi:putative oxidoreductase
VTSPKKLVSLYGIGAQHLTRYIEPLSRLLLRLLVARVFLLSGLTKWSGLLQFNTGKYDLFLYEFFCPDPPIPSALQLCNPETLDYTEGSVIASVIKAFAVSAGVMEILLPALLILGLFTRFAALGLLCMTVFIQLAVFPTWGHWWNPTVWWAMSLFVIFAGGPGKWSMDRWFGIEKTSAGNVE